MRSENPDTLVPTGIQYVYLLYVVPKISPIAELFVVRHCVIGQYFYYVQ